MLRQAGVWVRVCTEQGSGGQQLMVALPLKEEQHQIFVCLYVMSFFRALFCSLPGLPVTGLFLPALRLVSTCTDR